MVAVNAEPVDCAIAGGAVPGITRTDMLARLQSTFDDEAAERGEALSLPQGGTMRDDAGLVDTKGNDDVATAACAAQGRLQTLAVRLSLLGASSCTKAK